MNPISQYVTALRSGAGGVCGNYEDPSLTVIDGAASGAVVVVDRNHAGAGTIRFEYLTIQNGYVTNAGGGLAVIGGYGSSSRITVANSIIADNTTTKYGGGLCLSAAHSDVVKIVAADNTINANTTTWSTTWTLTAFGWPPSAMPPTPSGAPPN